jgi:hypothetical protein
MTKVLLLAALLGAAFMPSAHAHTLENRLFTCEGELIKEPGGYSIYQSWLKQEDMPMECYIDQKVVRRILAVCRVGDICVVSAKGESGNGNRYLIQKIFEVQRSPQTVKDLKPLQ